MGDLFELLDGLQPAEGEAPDAFLARLEATAREDDAGANLHRVKIGVALLASRPDKRKERTAWEIAQAGALNIKDRQFRNYLRAAEAVEQCRVLALAVPKEVLDRPLVEIPAAARHFGEHHNLDIPEKEKARSAPSLDARLEAIVKAAGRLPSVERWRAIRDARDFLADEYERTPRPPAAELLKGFKPAPMLGGYLGSKQSVAPEILELLAGWVPPDGSFARILVEPFCGLAAVSRQCLELGLVDRVRLNDKDPAVACLLTAVIRNPELLIHCVKTEAETLGPLTQERLDELWREVEEARERVFHPALEVSADAPVVLDLDHENVGVAASAMVLLGSKWTEGLHTPPVESFAAQNWDAEDEIRKIHLWHRILKGRVVGNCCTCADFEKVLEEPGWNLAFVDPPYDEKVPPYAAEFQEHQRLHRALTTSGRWWLLTYGDTPQIRDLYGEGLFRVVKQPVRRNRRKERGKAPELWIMPHEDGLGLFLGDSRQRPVG